MDRIQRINNQVTSKQCSNKKSSLSVTDNRTGKAYEFPITNNHIFGSDLLKVKSPSGEVTRYYDPGYTNTICCTSTIGYIDGDKGILQYRGYPIEQLAEKSTFTEVAYLLVHGELPTPSQYETWNKKIMSHTQLDVPTNNMITSFKYDAHPMGMLVSMLAGISTSYADQNPALQGGAGVYKDEQLVNKQIYRLLGKMPTIASACYRHRIGREPNQPNSNLSYVENFLYMMDRNNENEYKPHPKLVRAMDILFILHAEHELNCSTAAVRHLASSGVDIYTCMSGATAALYGPLHGGANEAVLRMLEEIGTVENIPKFIADVKAKKRRLMGFGHRVYKNYDPRATLIKKVAEEVFEVVGKEPFIDLAKELERIALNDQYFISKKLFPNVDFYTGVIYKAMGFPTDMFPILFAIPRTAGWIAHWKEFYNDKENKIVRPRQDYVGERDRNYVPMHNRKAFTHNLECSMSTVERRINSAVVRR